LPPRQDPAAISSDVQGQQKKSSKIWNSSVPKHPGRQELAGAERARGIWRPRLDDAPGRDIGYHLAKFMAGY